MRFVLFTYTIDFLVKRVNIYLILQNCNYAVVLMYYVYIWAKWVYELDNIIVH